MFILGTERVSSDLCVTTSFSQTDKILQATIQNIIRKQPRKLVILKQGYVTPFILATTTEMSREDSLSQHYLKLIDIG